MNTVDFSHVCIIELNVINQHLTLIAIVLLKHRVFQRGMSKYSIGTAAIYDIKKNRFKKKLRFIEKLKINSK
jgi:hypothetical protein